MAEHRTSASAALPSSALPSSTAAGDSLLPFGFGHPLTVAEPKEQHRSRLSGGQTAMHALRHFLVAVSLLLASAGTSFAATTAPPAAEATEHPALAALVAPRAADLRAADIQRIIARTGKLRRQVDRT
jgi:hypothetical protein